MQVTVAFTTQLKAVLGKPQHVLRVEAGTTVHDAILTLSKKYAEPFSQLVLHDGDLLPSILLSLNDEQVESTAQLSDGDVLTLLSAISGG